MYQLDEVELERRFEPELDEDCDEFLENNPFATVGVFNDDVDIRARGRPTNVEAVARLEGKRLRDRIRDELTAEGFTRPDIDAIHNRNRYNRPCEEEIE